MVRTAYQENGIRRRERGGAGMGKTRKFILALICLSVTLACGKLLIDKINMISPLGSPPANNAAAWGGGARADEAKDAGAWNLILVNRWNHMPDGYQADLTELPNGQRVDKRIYPALEAMFDAARIAGVYPVVVSGYRTADYQQSLLDEKVNEYEEQGYSASKAQGLAEGQVALPGTSEHQLGIAVDINADAEKSTGDEVYAWLRDNSYRYGFILRYPPDKTGITGTVYEPWHYRYVGVEAATDIQARGICLEEYLGKTKQPN